MGIYVFDLKTLADMLTEDAKRRDSSHDFGRDIIPRMVSGGMRAFAYPFESYWVDVGTVEAYWQTHMDLLKHPPPLDLNDRTWVVHTQSEERPPVTIQEGAVVKDSMITDGCVISPGARIERCVLSPGVWIGKNAIVRESVILTDSVVEEGARVDRAILDKAVRIGRRSRVGQRPKPGEGLGITTIGKNAQIPDRIAVRRGAVIDADATPEYFSASALRQRQRARRLRIAAAASGASAPPQSR
jgi:glucose-1-phosphate adenylyltransferase